MLGWTRPWWCLALVLVACTGEPGDPPPAEAACTQPNRLVDGRCLEPGVADDGCAAGTHGTDDGSCQPAGMTPEMCAEGFAHDGDVGCLPVLPAETCDPGWMAAPGDSACRRVMECGAGTWGDLPVDGDTEYVDAAYAGGNSDGSALNPWTTIDQAYEAAAPGALIAVAAGSYAENVRIIDKPVRLWGVCPERVEVVGVAGTAAVEVFVDATEVGGLRLTGSGSGLWVSGAENVTIDRIWVHDPEWRGIDIIQSSARVSGSLVEQSDEFGFIISDAVVEVEGSVARGTQPTASAKAGFGMMIQPYCGASTCVVDTRCDVTVRRSVIEDNHEDGIAVLAAHATLEGIVVRRTVANADGIYGQGIKVAVCPPPYCTPVGRASAVIRGSLIEENHSLGIWVQGSDATVETTVVRQTFPQAATQHYGRGINVTSCDPVEDPIGCTPAVPASLALRASLVEQNHEIGLYVAGAEATVEASVLRDTSPRADGTRGRNIQAQVPCAGDICNPSSPAQVAVRGSVLSGGHEASLAVGVSDATVESTLIRDILGRPDDGTLGDGVWVTAKFGAASVVVSSSRIADSHRAGIASWGAFVAVADTAIECGAFSLTAERFMDIDPRFEDRGGNGCGCPTATAPCKAVSATLEPPSF